MQSVKWSSFLTRFSSSNGIAAIFLYANCAANLERSRTPIFRQMALHLLSFESWDNRKVIFFQTLTRTHCFESFRSYTRMRRSSGTTTRPNSESWQTETRDSWLSAMSSTRYSSSSPSVFQTTLPSSPAPWLFLRALLWPEIRISISFQALTRTLLKGLSTSSGSQTSRRLQPKRSNTELNIDVKVEVT